MSNRRFRFISLLILCTICQVLFVFVALVRMTFNQHPGSVLAIFLPALFFSGYTLILTIGRACFNLFQFVSQKKVYTALNLDNLSGFFPANPNRYGRTVKHYVVNFEILIFERTEIRFFHSLLNFWNTDKDFFKDQVNDLTESEIVRFVVFTTIKKVQKTITDREDFYQICSRDNFNVQVITKQPHL